MVNFLFYSLPFLPIELEVELYFGERTVFFLNSKIIFFLLLLLTAQSPSSFTLSPVQCPFFTLLSRFSIARRVRIPFFIVSQVRIA